MPGMHGSKFANWALNRADLLITVGARFDDRVTGKLDAFAPGAKVIHMDIDPAEISKNRHADVPIVGELKRGAARAHRRPTCELRAQDSHRVDQREWHDQVEEWRFKHPFRYRRAGALKPRVRDASGCRDLLADRDVIWTTGVGQHQMWAAQWLQDRRSRGAGSPRAASARWASASRRRSARKLGVPGRDRRLHRRRRLLPDDDAGARHGRLSTTSRSSSRVINNGWLGMVRQWQELFHDERYSADAPAAQRSPTT